MYEGGIREPLLVRWPGTVKPGSVIAAPVTSPDFFPTLLEAAGAKPAPGQILDGVSLVPILRGGTAPDRAIFWQYPHYGNQGGAPAAAVRRGPWKLIHWFEDDRFELFNVVADLGEATDLAAREPARVVALRTELAAWQRTVGAKFPTANPTYDDTKPNGRASIRPGSPESNAQKAKQKK
jgi:arylsulfatase A-like enzyme